jgi:hypothetical protein
MTAIKVIERHKKIPKVPISLISTHFSAISNPADITVI